MKSPAHFVNYCVEQIAAISYLPFVVFFFWSQAHRREHQQLLYVLFSESRIPDGEEGDQIGTERVANKGGIGGFIENES